MTFPASDVVRTNADAGTDSPATFRTDALDLIDKFNLLRNHFSALAQTLINRSTAALMRTDLGAAASGANADITSLTALTAGGLPDNSVLTADIANAQVTPAKLSQPLTLGTSVATTSGTSVAITGIPSWARRITLQLLGVSTNGASTLMVQIGDSGGVETSGYLGGAATSSSGITTTASDSAGFILEAGGAFTASSIRYGHICLTLSDASNTWSMSSVTALTAGNVVSQAAGGKQTSTTMDRVNLTTVGGSETFDAGSLNILYE